MSGSVGLAKLQQTYFNNVRQLAVRNLSPLVKKMELKRLNQQFAAQRMELIQQLRLQQQTQVQFSTPEISVPVPTETYVPTETHVPTETPATTETETETPADEPLDESESVTDIGHEDRAVLAPLSAQVDNIKLTVSDSGSSKASRGPAKRALLIGCNYIGSDYRLKGCINDVNNLKDRLVSSYGFANDNVTVLTDQTAVKPTKQVILQEFTKLIQSSVDGDVLVFQFSGHGTFTLDRNGDEADGRDEMIVALDLQNIVDDDLNRILQTYLKPTVTLYAFFDSCHSGTVLDLQYQVLDTTKNNQATFNPKVKAIAGNVFMVSGCMDRQTSADAMLDNKAQGAMTWAFLNVTNGLAKKKQTWSYVLPAMRTVLQQNGYTQVPQLSSSRPIRFTDRLALLV